MNGETQHVPSEIWEEILLKVDNTQDMKNVSLVCQLFNGIVKEKLWNCPKLKTGMSVDNLLRLSHLPIKSIDTCDFGKLTGQRRGTNAEKLMDAICSFKQLTSLKLGWNIDLTYKFIGKLAVLKNLKSLTLEKLYAGISKAIAQIECLKLEAFCIEDLIFFSDVEPISKSLSKIQTLKMLEIQTNDGGCKHLSKLSNLEELIIRESELSKTGLNLLAKLPSLRKIKFCYCLNVSNNISILKTVNSSLKIEVEGEDDMDCDSDDYPVYTDGDYYDEDLPPEFLDVYNELHLQGST